MSFSPIVARRRGCQLAATVPVLTPPGKPPTWFPGEGLVTQARMCHLLSNMSPWNPYYVLESTKCHLKSFSKFSNFTSIFTFFEMFAYDRLFPYTYHFSYEFAWVLSKHIELTEKQKLAEAFSYNFSLNLNLRRPVNRQPGFQARAS